MRATKLKIVRKLPKPKTFCQIAGKIEFINGWIGVATVEIKNMKLPHTAFSHVSPFPLPFICAVDESDGHCAEVALFRMRFIEIEMKSTARWKSSEAFYTL